jgi:hypothetical protein
LIGAAATLENNFGVPQSVKKSLTYNPEIQLLGIFSGEKLAHSRSQQHYFL